jgi:hypothetical protein
MEPGDYSKMRKEMVGLPGLRELKDSNEGM